MNFLKHNYLRVICLGLIAYSMLGGLLLPLSPNIEKIDYTQTDSTLDFIASIPKLKDTLSDFYLKKTDIKKNVYILKSKSVQFQNNSHLVSFHHPKFYKGFDQGNGLDLFCQSYSSGDLNYFGAYFIDNVDHKFKLEKIELRDNPKPFSLSFPNRAILRESIRNLFFHVPMWFAMIGLLVYSLIQSIIYLSSQKSTNDIKAAQSAKVAMIFGTLGILTGMIWAKHTWGAYWTADAKLNGAAIGMLSYLAYFILRSSVEDEIKRAKLSAVYNIFSFTIYIVFIMIIPRINDSLHPGNGGNPGFNIYEQDNIMRLIFYPAVIGWGMLGFWLTEIYVKITEKAS